jgi:hypothetical protein
MQVAVAVVGIMAIPARVARVAVERLVMAVQEYLELPIPVAVAEAD